MRFLGAKYAKMRLRPAGAPPQIPLGEFAELPQTLYNSKNNNLCQLDLRGLLLIRGEGRAGKGRGEEGIGRERGKGQEKGEGRGRVTHTLATACQRYRLQLCRFLLSVLLVEVS